MTQDHDVVSTVPQDGDLVARARTGDADAYAELFNRHREAAARLARQLTSSPAEADDVVSDAFARVLHALRTGGGPRIAFRAYLLTVVRRAHVDRVRADHRLRLTDDHTTLEPTASQVEPPVDPVTGRFEQTTAARAYASLPERWQVVLWHTEVEGEKPADVAPLVGLSPNGVAALAYRAREGLRQAYLQMHVAAVLDESCRWTTEHLGGYVRGGLTTRQEAKIEAHLESCERCPAVALELTSMNQALPALLAPLVLGVLAEGYLASVGAAAAGAGVAAVVGAASGEAVGVGIAAVGTGASTGAGTGAGAGGSAGAGAGAAGAGGSAAGAGGAMAAAVAKIPGLAAASPAVAASIGVGVAAAVGTILFGLGVGFGGGEATNGSPDDDVRAGAVAVPADDETTSPAPAAGGATPGIDGATPGTTAPGSTPATTPSAGTTPTSGPTSSGGPTATVTGDPTAPPPPPPTTSDEPPPTTTSAPPPPPPPPPADLELDVRSTPSRLVAPIDARLDVRVVNVGGTASRTTVTVVPFHTLNINVLLSGASPGWSCDDQGSQPPYDELECNGPLLAPGASTTLAVQTSLKVPVAGRLAVRLDDGPGGASPEVVEIPVEAPNGPGVPVVAPGLLSGTERR